MAVLGHSVVQLVAYVLLAGGILLQFFTILSGYIERVRPWNRVYFLQANTTGIDGAPHPARWAYLSVCGVLDGRNVDCGPSRGAFPFDPSRNFNTTMGVPEDFLDTHYFYYMSRFASVFFLISMFFSVITLFSGLFACLTCFSFVRRIGSATSFALMSMAWVFQALFTTLMTIWSTKGHNRFRSNGQSASLGKYGYGFAWACYVCFFIASILYFLEMRKDKKSNGSVSAVAGTGAGAGGIDDYEKSDPNRSSFERMRKD